MPTLRRESAGSLQPRTLLESENPYESRRLTVEYDGVTTAAYLHDATTTVAATWIANHGPAPASTDVGRIESGQAPLMPAGHTKLPEGRPPFARRARVFWLAASEPVSGSVRAKHPSHSPEHSLGR